MPSFAQAEFAMSNSTAGSSVTSRSMRSRYDVWTSSSVSPASPRVDCMAS